MIWLRSLALQGILIAAACSPVAAAFSITGNRATFTTPSMVVAIDDGSIVRIFNRITGTDYLLPKPVSSSPEVSTGLVYAVPGVSKQEQKARTLGPTPIESGARVLLPVLKTTRQLGSAQTSRLGDAVEYRWGTEDAWLAIRFSLDPQTGDLLIAQRGGGKQKGLAAVRFGIGPVICNGHLLLPAMFGIKAAPANELYRFESSTWQWPTSWQLPLVVLKDPSGGVWVHAEDRALRFKSLHYREEEEKGVWSLGFDTENNAPFAAHDSIESVTWRVNVYAGSWTVPVDRYKRWSYAANHIEEKAYARPAWVSDIRLMIKHADFMMDNQMVPWLDALRSQVDPRRTFLYIDKWADTSKGEILPHWVASPRGIRFTEEARRRGFRVMYMANYIGITPNHPRIADFRPYFIRNPWSGEVEGWNLKWEWTQPGTMQLYYVNPASKAWRDYEIGQFRELYANHPADGLFVDQSFLMFNDGNGLVDGKTTIEGNLEYHKELADALPGVAIGGESVNEITMQYESFCELHPLSIHPRHDKHGKFLGFELNPGAFDRMVPVTSRFLLPHTRPIGYVAFPPTTSPDYAAWRDSLRIYEGVPTLTRPTLGDLNDPESEARRVIHDTFSKKLATSEDDHNDIPR